MDWPKPQHYWICVGSYSQRMAAKIQWRALESSSRSPDNYAWRPLKEIRRRLSTRVQAVLTIKSGHTKYRLSSLLELYQLVFFALYSIFSFMFAHFSKSCSTCVSFPGSQCLCSTVWWFSNTALSILLQKALFKKLLIQFLLLLLWFSGLLLLKLMLLVYLKRLSCVHAQYSSNFHLFTHNEPQACSVKAVLPLQPLPCEFSEVWKAVCKYFWRLS